MFAMDNKNFDDPQASNIDHPEETLPIPVPQDASRALEDGADLSFESEPTEPDVDFTEIQDELSEFEDQPPLSEMVESRKPPGKRNISGLGRTFLGVLALVIIALLSGLSGYASGIGMRKGAEATQVAQAVDTQFQMGVKELEEGQYFRARQRFEYVIRIDPAYPGAVDNLAQALMYLNTTATPTLVPTPVSTPTPDLRGVQELLDQSKQFILDANWDNAVNALLSLRKADPEFSTVDVDGMLFLALRNRGRDKIINQADLEGGIYDLTLASQFGLLDTEAKGLLNWTSLYITGASFWEIDWGQAAYYFGQVAPHLPNLRDGSGLTAIQRYRTSLFNYAKLLAQDKRWCDAAAQLEIALRYVSDAELQNAYADLSQRCANQQKPKVEATLPTVSP